MDGPRSEPPIPMLTTVVMRSPVAPSHSRRAPGPRTPPSVQDLVHLGDHVDTVDHELGVPGHPQRDVEHRSILGDVDVLAREHRVAALGDTRVRGESQQQRHRLVGDEVLGVVEVEIAGFGGEPVPSVVIGGEQVPQGRRPDGAGVGGERLPGGRTVDRRSAHVEAFSSCPPNSLRMADSTLLANSADPCEANRSNTAADSTWAGTPSSIAACSVHRPSPESLTLPVKPSRAGSFTSADAVRSSSHELTTLPRRHTSATSAISRSYR